MMLAMALGASRRFTVGAYHRMAEVGILGEDERVELIDGAIVEMTPIGSRHAGCVRWLAHRFTSSLGDRAIVSVRNPIQLSELSEPQPDLALLKPRADFYRDSHPESPDVLLVVEVIESSMAYDRAKLSLYAAAGITEVWLVDLPRGTVERYRRPSATGYEETTSFTGPDQFGPAAFPDLLTSAQAVMGD